MCYTNSFKKCHVSFEHNFKQLDLGFVHKNVLLRITQEFIQNSIKHSRCKNIFISLNTSEDILWELDIRDDGIGFDTSQIKSNGIGLTNMKNRAEIIVAGFRMESQEIRGTQINIILKNGNVIDVRQASEQFRLNVLTESTKKYFMCFPNYRLEF